MSSDTTVVLSAPENARVCLVAITKHGAALAARLAADLPQAHMKMLRNEHKPGNMSVLVQSPTTGLRTLEEVLDAKS